MLAPAGWPAAAMAMPGHRGATRGFLPDLGRLGLAGSRRRRWASAAISPPPPNPDDGLLERLLGGHVSPELLGLWLVEVTLSAGLFYLLLSASGAAPSGGWLGGGAPLRALNQAAALALTFGLISVAVGLYSADTYLRTRRVLINTAVGTLLASPAIWLVSLGVGLDPAGWSAAPPRAWPAVLTWALLLFALRLAFSLALRADLFVRRVLIIGEDASAWRLREAMQAHAGGLLRVVAVLPPDDAAALAPRALRRHKVWAVVLTAAACERLAARQILRARECGVRLYSDTAFWERRLRRIDVNQPGPAWRWPDAAAAGGGAAGRLADIALSLALLAVTLPLMLLTVIAIVCDSRGPVLYRQERVGLHGRPFTLLKFRSMRQDAEARGPVWASQRDPRVTRVGAIIRLTRIDELPQLLCVLRGQMSFIGPRPERPHFVAQLEQAVPFYRDRLLVKPGLTGWAQVNYPYGASVEDARAKLSYDLYYVKHRSLLLDLHILLATVRVVLFQRGAR